MPADEDAVSCCRRLATTLPTSPCPARPLQTPRLTSRSSGSLAPRSTRTSSSHFLNDMLDLDLAHRIVSVELLPPEQRPPVAELKLL